MSIPSCLLNSLNINNFSLDFQSGTNRTGTSSGLLRSLTFGIIMTEIRNLITVKEVAFYCMEVGAGQIVHMDDKFN